MFDKKCEVEGHEQFSAAAVCLQSDCSQKLRLMCVEECTQELHKNHSYVHLSNLGSKSLIRNLSTNAGKLMTQKGEMCY